jgi:predicted RNase H-like nuclease (RuvC/YqgF family)
MYSVEIKNNKEIYDFCMVNGITDINKFIQDCFKQGFDLKKYGLLGEQEKRVEIPVEVIKEVEKIVEVTKEIPVDRVVEVIKEVPVEKIVTIYDKIDNPELLLKIQQLENEMSNKDKELDEFRRNLEPNLDNNKVKMLETTLQNLRKELKLKNEKINELEDKLLKQNDRDIDATYLNGSNLNKKI